MCQCNQNSNVYATRRWLKKKADGGSMVKLKFLFLFKLNVIFSEFVKLVETFGI